MLQKLIHYLQWALGVICHEFLTAFPPFHAETPEQVFDNILSRRIDWHDDEVEWSPEARDFVDKLLCPDSSRRLGAKGAEEVKRHPFLRGINWTKLREAEANFVPQVADPESTDYFDDRGAATQVFEVDHAEQEPAASSVDGSLEQLEATASAETSRRFDSRGGTPADDFGTFNFKNLDVLKQANDDVIRKLRHDQLIPPVAEVNAVSSVSRKSKPKRDSIAEHRVSFDGTHGHTLSSLARLISCLVHLFVRPVSLHLRLPQQLPPWDHLSHGQASLPHPSQSSRATNDGPPIKRDHASYTGLGKEKRTAPSGGTRCLLTCAERPLVPWKSSINSQKALGINDGRLLGILKILWHRPSRWPMRVNRAVYLIKGFQAALARRVSSLRPRRPLIVL